MHLLIILIGLVWGSFLSVVLARADDPKSIIFGRSICPKCKHQLSPFDLVPIVSFLVQSGKCRYCKERIPFKYPILEILSLAVTYLIYYKLGINFSAVLLFLSLSFLLISSFQDIECKEVDLSFFIIGIFFALLYSLLSSNGFITHLWGGLSAMAIPLLIFSVSRERWMGFGDVLFAFWIGLILAYPVSLVGISLAFFIGAIFGIIVLAKRRGDSEVPFGPFLSLSCLLSLWIGDSVIRIYLENFF